MKKYALIGEKLSHSYSKLIHEEIYKELNICATYTLLEVEKDKLKDAIELLRNGTYQGFNVTIPYKIEVMKHLDEISPEAKEIGSCNTIANVNGKLIGYNTDYYGFFNELTYYNVDCNNKNCYILGTGGASLAIEKALKDKGGFTTFVSRNPKNSKTISYEELKNKDIDVLVNTTPVGMYPNISHTPVDIDILKKAKEVIDIIFNPSKTMFLSLANSDKNGLFMLVGQAIKAEEIWQGYEYKNNIIDLVKKVEVMIK